MNREIVVRTQAELDAVPIDFSGTIYITGGTLGNSISVSNSYVSSCVEARENSHVEARENSHVEAWGNVGVWLYSDNSTVFLFMFSVCWKLGKGQVTRRSKSATVITPKPLDWFDANCVENKKTITLYKRVSSDFRTQEGKANETTWTIGSTLKVPNWNPDNSECGEGKFHACSRPYFCDEFRSTVGDRYIAISVKRKDTHQWPSPAYPHKIAFREGKVLYEVDRYGTRI